jgi:hypothetical protein
MNNLEDCRDRTSEFFSRVTQIQKVQQSSARLLCSNSGEFDERPDDTLLSGGRRSSDMSQLGQQQHVFTQKASYISHSIHRVTVKLGRLGKLARQRSLFNDPVDEINELTFVIKDELGLLQGELEKLAGWATASPSSTTSHGARHSTAVVNDLKQELMRTTKSFQDVLQVRTKMLKEQHQRRTQFELSEPVSVRHRGSSFSHNYSHGGSNTIHTASVDTAAAAVSASHNYSANSGVAAMGNAAIKRRGTNAFEALMNAASASASSSSDFESTLQDDVDLSFVTLETGGMVGLQQTQMQQAADDQSDEYLSARARVVEDIEGTLSQLGSTRA